MFNDLNIIHLKKKLEEKDITYENYCILKTRNNI